MSRSGQAGFILTVCLILGQLGPLDLVPEKAGILLGLALWAGGAVRPRELVLNRGRFGRSMHAWAPVLAGAPLLLRAERVETRLAILTLIALASPAPARLAGAAFVSAALAWRLLLAQMPWIWSFEVELSRLVSQAAGWATGQALDFGPTASGTDLFVIFVLHMAASRLAGGSWSWKKVAAASLTLPVFMALLPSMAASPHLIPFDATDILNMAGEHLASTPGGLARLMFGWSAALFVGFCLCLIRQWRGAQVMAARDPRLCAARSRASPAAAVTISTLLALLLAAGSRPAGPRRPGEILLLKSPAFDMSVPAARRYGLQRAGMFGMLPRYLELDGHRTRVQPGPVTSDLLRGVSILVVPLPLSPFSRAETAQIRSFVAAGGSLLVLGDHTDLMGIMGPVNGLLAPWGIAMRFDSAYAAVHEWHACLDGPRLARGRRTGIGTGASLQIGRQATPVVVGRYAHSDAGDRRNTGAGAYLGNYALDEGELLGDLVLAAETRHGQGQVVAFGDTSSFQNISLPFSYSFVASLMDELGRPPREWERLLGTATGLTAGILGGLALAGSALATGGLAAAILATSLIWTFPGESSPWDRLPPDARVALVDAAHLNSFTHSFWKDESIGGLLVNLQRNNYLPIVTEHSFAMRPPGAASLPVIVAPRRALAEEETRVLARHLEGGGDMLVAVSGEQRHAVAPLLSRYGLSIQDLPLGPVPVRAGIERASLERALKEPQFRNAYPLVLSGRAHSRVLYRAFDRDIVAEIQAGERGGRLLVIGDADFLTDRILENEKVAWEGNVTLLARLLSRSGVP